MNSWSQIFGAIFAAALVETDETNGAYVGGFIHSGTAGRTRLQSKVKA